VRRVGEELDADAPVRAERPAVKMSGTSMVSFRYSMMFFSAWKCSVVCLALNLPTTHIAVWMSGRAELAW
jgi:hypothetical protein